MTSSSSSIRALLEDSLHEALGSWRSLLSIQSVTFGPAALISSAVVALYGSVLTNEWMEGGNFPRTASLLTVAAVIAVVFVAHALSATAVARLPKSSSSRVALRYSVTHLSASLGAMMPTYGAASVAFTVVAMYGVGVAWSLESSPDQLGVVATVGAAMVFVVLGMCVWLGVRYARAPAIVALDDVDGRAARERSAGLARGRFVRTWFLSFLVTSLALTVVLLSSLAIPSPDLGGANPRDIRRAIPALVQAQWMFQLVWTAAFALVTAFSGVLWTNEAQRPPPQS